LEPVWYLNPAQNRHAARASARLLICQMELAMDHGAEIRNPNGSKVPVAFTTQPPGRLFGCGGAHKAFPHTLPALREPRLPAAGRLLGNRPFAGLQMFPVERNYDWSIKR
jgi:hypothetical protein